MKPRLTLFLATILMFSFGHSKAQDYLPTVKEGNTWVVRWDIGMMGFSWADTVTYTLQGDTVIGGYSYLKVIRLPSYYAGAAREDTLNKKIFTITRGQTVESLRFNFNLQAGDYVWVNELPTVSTTVINQQGKRFRTK